MGRCVSEHLHEMPDHQFVAQVHLGVAGSATGHDLGEQPAGLLLRPVLVEDPEWPGLPDEQGSQLSTVQSRLFERHVDRGGGAFAAVDPDDVVGGLLGGVLRLGHDDHGQCAWAMTGTAIDVEPNTSWARLRCREPSTTAVASRLCSRSTHTGSPSASSASTSSCGCFAAMNSAASSLRVSSGVASGS